MKRASSFLAFALGASSMVLACGVDETQPVLATSGDGGADGGAAGFVEPATACADAEAAIYGDPGALPADKGAIIKCSKGGELTKDQIAARLSSIGSTAVVTSGARTFKVSYRTERGNGQPGYSSAIVYVPTTPRADKLPIVVAGRGTRGQGAACAISKADVNAAPVENDYARLVLTMVGNGFAIIVPDLPGYANYGAQGNPPSGYAQAEDVGKATLDGSRALKKMFPQLEDKTVLVGHSQGGHTVLAALSLAESYGAQGSIAGVAAYAPLWLSQRSWGALLDRNTADALGYTMQKQPFANAVATWYHYTQAELLDGPGEGEKLFKPEKRAAVKQFIDNTCVSGPFDVLTSQGTYLADLHEDAFVNSIGFKAAFGGDCAGDAVCDKWIKRYSADRPHLTGAAATTPIFMAYGMKDTTIPPNRMRCALDRLKADGVNLTVCVEPEATHNTVLDLRGQHVAQWVANLTLPGSAGDLPSCPAGAEAIEAVNCATPPPND
jgi:pimeloyl-ACP methyl ester carboxylesterase